MPAAPANVEPGLGISLTPHESVKYNESKAAMRLSRRYLSLTLFDAVVFLGRDTISCQNNINMGVHSMD